MAAVARALCLAVAALLCMATPAPPPVPPRPFAAWGLAGDARTEAGCARAEAWVSKSGKSGVGVTVRLHNPDGAAPCAAGVARAEWRVGGAVAAEAPAAAAGDIEPCGVRHVYLPFAFDNEGAWNRGAREGELRVVLAAGGVERTWTVRATHAYVQLPAPAWRGAEPAGEEQRCGER